MRQLFTYIRAGFKETVRWTFYSVFLALLPVWGGALVVRLVRVRPTFQMFTSSGEFALYSASLLGGALYVISKDRAASSRFPYRHSLFALSITLLFASLIVFGVVTAARVPGTGGLVLDIVFLQWTTLIVFGFSFLLCFLVTAIDTTPSSEEVQHQASKSFRDLETGFDQVS